MVLEKILVNPLDSKEISQSILKEIRTKIFTRRTDAEAPILWSPDVKSRVSGKDTDAGKD